MNPNSAPISHPQAQKYQQLKGLDEALDAIQQERDKSRQLYHTTLEEFATLCHQLWSQEKAPGNHRGKGFRRKLGDAGIKAGRAYRAMKKFFPADFPTQKKPDGTAPAVSFRFTGPRNGNHASEVLECVFALTMEEKTEFQRCLKLVGPQQVQRLLLESLQQAAGAKEQQHQQQPEKPIRENKKDKHEDNVEKQNHQLRPESAPSLQPQLGNGIGNGNGGVTHEPQVIRHRRLQPSDREPTVYDAFVRLTRLNDSLKLDGRHPDLLSVAHQYDARALKLTLDWIDAHPEWCARLRGKPVMDFVHAFQRLLA